MLKKTLLTLMLAAVATVATGETVYKWVDARGQVHYTDRPPTESGARILGVLESAVGFANEEDAQDDAMSPTNASFAAADESDSGAGSAAAAAAVQRDVATVRADLCKQAQERYKQYIESQRLFRQTEDGQREYLSDAELTQTRIQAKQAVDEYCQ
jgi:hypothetical protein